MCWFSEGIADEGFRKKTGGPKIEDDYLVIEQLEVAGVDIHRAKAKPFVLEADAFSVSVASKDLSWP